MRPPAIPPATQSPPDPGGLWAHPAAALQDGSPEPPQSPAACATLPKVKPPPRPDPQTPRALSTPATVPRVHSHSHALRSTPSPAPGAPSARPQISNPAEHTRPALVYE